jgi:hypothetical protein
MVVRVVDSMPRHFCDPFPTWSFASLPWTSSWKFVNLLDLVINNKIEDGGGGGGGGGDVGRGAGNTLQVERRGVYGIIRAIK